jgi:hypothetical protein
MQRYLKTTLSSKDFNAFSPAQHLSKLLSLDDTLKSEINQLISVYAWGEPPSWLEA